MNIDDPKNIGELIEYLKTLPPETQFVTEYNVFEWALRTWKPELKKLLRDGYQENILTATYLGHNPDDVVDVIEVG